VSVFRAILKFRKPLFLFLRAEFAVGSRWRSDALVRSFRRLLSPVREAGRLYPFEKFRKFAPGHAKRPKRCEHWENFALRCGLLTYWTPVGMHRSRCFEPKCSWSPHEETLIVPKLRTRRRKSSRSPHLWAASLPELRTEEKLE